MTKPNDKELDVLVMRAHRYTYKAGHDEALFVLGLSDAITALRAQLAEAQEDIDKGAKDYCALMERHDAEKVRADRAEAERAAQIEADAGIADDYVEMRELQISTEKAKAAHHIDVPQLMRWGAGKVQSQNIADDIRAQPHDRTALDRIIADTRAKALWDAARTVWSEYDESDARYWGETIRDTVRKEKSAAILAMIDKEGA